MTQNEIDALSVIKAKELFASGAINDIEVGTVRGLQDIHDALFISLYRLIRKIMGDTVLFQRYMVFGNEYLTRKTAER